MPNGNHTGATTHRARHGEPQPAPVAQATLDAESAPTKRDLASWWKNFKRGPQRREDEKAGAEAEPQGIFGVPLQTSVRYANVAISLYDHEGNSYIYGYVPIVVAKCGVFLKEKATDVEGIFRLSGSEKRIKELRTQFNSPNRYGKGLDWSGYTVHDAANILRRYFNQLPEPIIPLEFYDRFRDPLRNHQSQAVGPMDGQSPSEGEFDVESAIKRYQQLITELPPLNRQLLLYILDLLAVFASKSDLNKMTTPNLAAIFQPGILSHPAHDMAPPEYRLSQDVLIFLIENQDHFLIGMQGTAADPQTVQEVESGPPTPQIRTPASKTPKTVGRSGSSASKYSGMVRRSVSVSSKHSRGSVGPITVTPLHSPGTPGTSGGGVHRSNTVPSNKSPAISTGRFQRDNPSDPPTPGSARQGLGFLPGSFPEDKDSQYVAAQSTHLHPNSPGIIPPSSSEGTTPLASPQTLPSKQEMADATTQPGGEKLGVGSVPTPTEGSNLSVPQGQATSGNATRAALSNFFTGKPPPGDARKPNKLQKKRLPGSANPSAHSSQNSVAGAEVEGSMASIPVSTASNAPLLNTQTPGREHPQFAEQGTSAKPPAGTPLKPAMSPTGSFRSHSTATEPEHAAIPADASAQSSQMAESAREMSDLDPTADKEKKRRWFSRKDKDHNAEPDRALAQSGIVPPNPLFASNEPAQRSRNSVASGTEGSTRKSMNVDHTGSNAASPEPHASPSTVIPLNDAGSAGAVAMIPERDGREREKNPIHWLKGKLAERAEKKEERDRLKEEARARSPPATRGDKEHRRGLSGSMQSLTAQMSAEPSRGGRSMDIPRDRAQREPSSSMDVPREQATRHSQPQSSQPAPTQTPQPSAAFQPLPQIVQQQPQPEPAASLQAAEALRRGETQPRAQTQGAATVNGGPPAAGPSLS